MYVSYIKERFIYGMVDEDGIYRIYETDGTCKYNPDKEVTVYDPLSTPISDPLAKMNKLSPKLDENGKIMTAKSKIEGKTIKAANSVSGCKPNTRTV